MIPAIILVVYASGWMLSIGGSLKRIMLKEVCTRCLGRDVACTQAVTTWSRGNTAKVRAKITHTGAMVPRGSVADRDGLFVFAAMLTALAWPIRLLLKTVVGITLFGGRCVRDAVLKTTPLTGPELERKIRMQHSEIERLTDEIANRAREELR